MASQSSTESCEAMLGPPASGEAAIEGLSSSSLVPNVDSGKALVQLSEEAVSQAPTRRLQVPGSQGQVAVNKQGSDILCGLSFPRKLWMIVEDPAFESVCWNEDGDTVIIENDLFQREVLLREDGDRIFETDSIKTFTRQLNLYGFSKIRSKKSALSPGNKKMMIYRNVNFQRDKPALLANIQRKGDQRRFGRQSTCGASPKKRKLVAARRSPRTQPNKEDEEAERRAQREAASAHSPISSQSLMFSGIWSMSNITVSPLRIYAPEEPRGPSGEGTSSNVLFAPPGTAGMQGAGEATSSPVAYPDYDSMISLYTTCYSILLAALFTMTYNQPLEQESPSNSRCIFCERVRENPPP
ncbi:heat shock transcription factor, X-linked member 3-like [Oryctolagus cuniculus]|uniref:heat shock transcription factor, X-linked member 3 n=1 Tax=Oryctolagus cuniculus TaxID=9986 RepID=UPI00222E47B9|nr:heat shock transcription factor, X-linked member 3 [Oryctolagus cuniculus]